MHKVMCSTYIHLLINMYLLSCV